MTLSIRNDLGSDRLEILMDGRPVAYVSLLVLTRLLTRDGGAQQLYPEIPGFFIDRQPHGVPPF